MESMAARTDDLKVAGHEGDHVNDVADEKDDENPKSTTKKSHFSLCLPVSKDGEVACVAGDDDIAWEDECHDPFLDSFPLRSKGLLDGCRSLAEVVERFRCAADQWNVRVAEGYELYGPVVQDRAHVVHPEGKRFWLTSSSSSAAAAAAEMKVEKTSTSGTRQARRSAPKTTSKRARSK